MLILVNVCACVRACVRACLPACVRACVRGHDMRIIEEHPISYTRGQHCAKRKMWVPVVFVCACVLACVRPYLRVVCVCVCVCVCHTPDHSQAH